MATHEIEPTTPGTALPSELVANTTGSAVDTPKVSGEFSGQDDQLDGALIDLGLDQEVIGIEAGEEVTANVLVEPPAQNEQEHEPTRFDKFWCSTAGRKTTALVLALGLSGAACSSSEVENEQPEANPIEVTTTSETAVEDMTLSEMLDQFVDENGMPNRKIETRTDDPEDFVSILYHNAACAINTRDVTCADNIYFNDKNPPILLNTIAEFADKNMLVKVDINEIISIETNGSGETEVSVIVTDNILIKTATSVGYRDDTSLEKLTLVKLADGTFANTLVVVVQNLEDY